MTEDERALLVETAKAIAHILGEGGPELDGEIKCRLLTLIPRVESRGLPPSVGR